MKRLLILLLLFSYLTAYAQEHRAIKTIATFATWSILNGIGDGLNDSGHKGWGHTTNAAAWSALLAGTIWSEPDKKDWYVYFGMAAGARYGTFDPAYNITRDLPYDYIGTTAPIDKALRKVPSGFRTFTRGLVLVGTVGFTINTLGYQKHFRRNKTFDPIY